MSDDLNELERRLEQITAAQVPADVQLDPESAELRATWLALGKLLDAARTDLGRPEAPARSAPVGRPWRLTAWAALAAIAATLFLAVTVAWHLRGRPESTPSDSLAEATAEKPSAAPRPRGAGGNRQVAVSLPSPRLEANPQATVSRQTRLEWSDPLDQQIDRAGRAIVQMRDDCLASVQGAGLIQSRFESMRKGIDGGTFE